MATLHNDRAASSLDADPVNWLLADTACDGAAVTVALVESCVCAIAAVAASKMTMQRFRLRDGAIERCGFP